MKGLSGWASGENDVSKGSEGEDWAMQTLGEERSRRWDSRWKIQGGRKPRGQQEGGAGAEWIPQDTAHCLRSLVTIVSEMGAV